MSSRATGRDIIQAILDNLDENLEPLMNETLVPSVFHVYLHPDDSDRLRGVLERLEADAIKSLSQKLDELNGSDKRSFRWLSGKAQGKQEEYVRPGGDWSITFQEDPDEELAGGDVLVVSELAREEAEDYSDGSKTRLVATIRRQGSTKSKVGSLPSKGHHPEATRKTSETAKKAGTNPSNLARISFTDQSGPRTYFMRKEHIAIGREHEGSFLDLGLVVTSDVSRDHLRLRFDSNSNHFLIKDLSTLGTTVNGSRVRPSLRYSGDNIQDDEIWEELPSRAKIGLADKIVLDFERSDR